MKFKIIICFIVAFSSLQFALNAQVFNVDTFLHYRDDNIICDNNDIEWKESLKSMAKAGLYTIKQDGSAVHEFDYPIEGKNKDEIYDYALDVYRTNYYSVVPNIEVFDWASSNKSFVEKENDIIGISKEQCKISWTFRSPTFFGSWMGLPTYKFSSKSIIDWQIHDGNIHVIETVEYLNVDSNPGKDKRIFTPSELHPFGKWSGGMFGMKTSISPIERCTNQAILSCYMADQIILSRIREAIYNKINITNIATNHRFLLQPSGDFLTKDGKGFIVEQFDGLSAHELFTKFRSAITLLYKSSKDNISYVEDNVISVNATTQRDFYWEDNFNTNIQYVLKFQFRDGRVRIQAPTIISLYKSSLNGESTFKDTAKEFKIFINDEPFQLEMINGLNSIINDIINRNINKVIEISESDDDDW